MTCINDPCLDYSIYLVIIFQNKKYIHDCFRIFVIMSERGRFRYETEKEVGQKITVKKKTDKNSQRRLTIIERRSEEIGFNLQMNSAVQIILLPMNVSHLCSNV